MVDFPIIATKDALIIRVKELEDETTSTGIIITGAAINKNDHHGVFAEVLAVGPQVKQYKIGQTILVNKFDCVPFPHKTEILHFTTDPLVRAIVK